MCPIMHIKYAQGKDLKRKSVILRFKFFTDYATIGTRDRSKGKIDQTQGNGNQPISRSIVSC